MLLQLLIHAIVFTGVTLPMLFHTYNKLITN
jgi:hypothetical protein